ncbi:hypothetical protein LCGC14_0473900 [marine sediment metagenome]|uniref:Uncharacterized protein n=1 Tax=marine sediment metagenome TaxID=412755 RepID=A0A0F9SBB6_9ZZZZ|nr:hypothetical protein [bacterium]
MNFKDIIERGNKLLEDHSNLFNRLKYIPETREMTFQIINDGDLNIGKPRFKKRNFLWSVDLLAELRDHLEDVWNFFDTYSHWIDNSLFSLISYTKRRESKKSLIFLLEKDVWETSEVYGDYLIEKRDNHTIISYYRFNMKMKSFKIKVSEDSEIKAWILMDAVDQIINQFRYLWSKIETEIKTCINEKYHKEPKLLISSNYLKKQLEKTKEIADVMPEAALLNLGRICEMWLLIKLEKDSSGFSEDSLKLAERNNIIDKDEFKFLKKVRRNYNDLKHKRYYIIKKSLIISLINEFSNLFKL